MAAAVEAFLRAAGHDPEKNRDLERTPARVSQAWCEALLDGYGQNPLEILGDRFEGADGTTVVLRDISFHSMCPHHLLPYFGTAHVAFVPVKKTVGFSRIIQLVDCFAHRLTLQERIGRRVAAAVCEILGARAAACALEATQTCVTLRGVCRPGTRIRTEAQAGEPRMAAELASLLRGP